MMRVKPKICETIVRDAGARSSLCGQILNSLLCGKKKNHAFSCLDKLAQNIFLIN